MNKYFVGGVAVGFIARCIIQLFMTCICLVVITGCGSKIVLIEKENETIVKTNYRGKFEVRKKGLHIKGENKTIEYPEIPPLLNINLGKKEVE